jgi:uncharacterized protein YegP (UPF0339 family)
MKRKPTLRIYRNRAGRWQWQLRASNGEPLAQGCGEKANGFASARSAWRNANVTARALEFLRFAKLPREGTETVTVGGIGNTEPHWGLRITREDKPCPA